ncbi:MAG: efflux RND transporter permease subunit [Acidobacteriota bacterium]|nr:MAG: efflux RND transporter permease subunit [Acidobacteriota bacterium]
MNLAEVSLSRKTSTFVLTFLLFVGGVVSFFGLGKLEDPEFTIKEAVVMTQYPGATPVEVEKEVTETLEEAIQALGQLYEVRSISKPGLSIIYAKVQDKYDKHTLPQVWDELRRKVGDAQTQLPPGAGPSIVNDDFGDVFGIFLAITGEGYSTAELADYADLLKRELLLVSDVAKINFWGRQSEVVYVEMSRAQMSQLGITPATLAATLGYQNSVENSGRFRVSEEYIRFDPTGMFDSVEDIENLLIRGGGSQESLVYLRDIATVRRGLAEPPNEIMLFDGKPALGLGISTVQGGDAVRMGEGVRKRLAELKSRTPVGMELSAISFQSDDVTVAINGFMINLAEAVVIVLIVLMIFMGWRSASLIGGILLLTIVASFVFLSMWGVVLQRISLGALIIALGMLVDNAIVVVEGVLIGIEKGENRFKVAIQTVAQNSWPLLGATIVAILAFSAIGVSQDSTGEFCRSLFQVILVSLLLSWVFAVTVTPVACTMFLKAPEGAAQGDAYGGKFFVLYRRLLEACLRLRWLTLATAMGLFLLSLLGFGYVSQSFFPDSTRAQFYIDFWLPEGTHIYETQRQVEELDAWVRELDGVTSTSVFVGRGALRLMLTYTAEDTNSSFGHIMISVDDYRKVEALGKQISQHIAESFPEARGWYKKFVVGPGPAAKIEARFRGSDPDVLRDLAEQAKQIMRDEGDAANIRDDWRQKVKVMRPVFSETAARMAGVTRADVAAALKIAYDGKTMGLYREEDDLLPIISRAPESERDEVTNVLNLQVFASGTNRNVPLSQVVSRIDTVFEDQIVRHHDRLRVIKAQCDPTVTTSEDLRARLEAKILAQINLPDGYEFDWSGEYESSTRAQAALATKLPPVIILMILIVVLLFDRLKQPLVIFLTVPLAIIGVVVGLLVTNNPFGFMALLGLLSLVGMLIKNAIVLIDQTDLNIREGMDPYESVVMAGVSRTRPVAMAALTTMLGMLPLFQDAFFVAMAVTIVFGLGFATVLTLILVPTLYATVFGIHPTD